MRTAAPVAAGAGVLFRGASVHLACAPPVASPHPSLADVRSQVPRTVPLLPSHRVRAPRGPLRVGPSPCSRYAHEPRSHPAGLTWPHLVAEGWTRKRSSSKPPRMPTPPPTYPPTHRPGPRPAPGRVVRAIGLRGRAGVGSGGWSCVPPCVPPCRPQPYSDPPISWQCRPSTRILSRLQGHLRIPHRTPYRAPHA